MTYLQNKDLTVNRYRRTKFANTFTGVSGALGEGDRGAYQAAPDNSGNPFQYSNFIDRWRQYCKLYEMCWEARKIIRIPVEDALRKPWDVENIPDKYLVVLRKEEKRFKFEESLKKAWMLERLLGGSVQFFGMDSDKDDVSEIYDPRINPAKIRFINVIPLSRISRVNWDTNPLSEGYMRPSEFIINGQTLHLSRCIVWDGEPLFDPYDFALTQFRANLAGFGPSKLAPIWDDIIKAVGTRQAAYQMIQTNNAIIMAVSELQDLMATNPGKKNIATLKEIANNLSVFRAAIINKDKVDITQQAASFGSVPELLLMFLQVLSAASDIPATRFLGQAPGGLNATGESDLENYYNMIDSLQRMKLQPAILRFYDLVGYQRWPDSWDRIREDIELKFPPLWNINELEEAQKNQIELANVFQAWEAGLMPDEKAIEELNLKQVFSVDLDESDMDVLKGMQAEQDLYGSDDTENINFKSGSKPPTSSSDEGVGDSKGGEEKIGTTPVKTPPPKKPSLPKISNKYDPEQFRIGMEEEAEHNDLTQGDPVEIAKIVKAHLDEDPEYYTKLKKIMNKNQDFKEQEHPRDSDGKFTAGTGSTEVKKKEVKPKKTDEEKRKAAEDRFTEQMKDHSPEDVAMHKKAREMKIRIPPAWTNVWINPDQSGKVLAKGKDVKGRVQRAYSAKHTGEATVKKHLRVRQFTKDYKEITKTIKSDFTKSEEAKVLYLISKTGFRIGNEKDTGADEQAYGASTLLGKHISVSNNNITFDFTGKSGVTQKHMITDSLLAKEFEKRKGQEKIFNTSYNRALTYIKKITDGKYMIKDFRTYFATKTALQVMKGMESPKTEKELKKAILEVATAVSQKLGNTPQMARDEYIDPLVFEKWSIKEGKRND